MHDLDNIPKEFLVRSYKALNPLDHKRIVLEHGLTSPDTLGNMVRTIHNPGEICELFGFPKLKDRFLLILDSERAIPSAVVDAQTLKEGN